MNTKGERRDKKRRKRKYGMRVDGSGNRLLQRIVQDKAKEAERAASTGQ